MLTGVEVSSLVRDISKSSQLAMDETLMTRDVTWDLFVFRDTQQNTGKMTQRQNIYIYVYVY